MRVSFPNLRIARTHIVKGADVRSVECITDNLVIIGLPQMWLTTGGNRMIVTMSHECLSGECERCGGKDCCCACHKSCPRCKGTGKITFQSDYARRNTEIECYECDGTGEV